MTKNQDFIYEMQSKGFIVSHVPVIRCDEKPDYMKYWFDPTCSLQNGFIVMLPPEGTEYIFYGIAQCRVSSEEYSRMQEAAHDQMQKSSFFTLISQSVNKSRIEYNNQLLEDVKTRVKYLENLASSFKLYLESEGKQLPDDATLRFQMKRGSLPPTEIARYPYSYFKNEFRFETGIRTYNKGGTRNLMISCEDYAIDSYKIEIRNVDVIKLEVVLFPDYPQKYHYIRRK